MNICPHSNSLFVKCASTSWCYLFPVDQIFIQEKRESPTTERISTWSYCGEICYDNKVIREHGDKGSSLPPIHPLIQPNEEWLRDYEQPPTKITH